VGGRRRQVRGGARMPFFHVQSPLPRRRTQLETRPSPAKTAPREWRLLRFNGSGGAEWRQDLALGLLPSCRWLRLLSRLQPCHGGDALCGRGARQPFSSVWPAGTPACIAQRALSPLSATARPSRHSSYACSLTVRHGGGEEAGQRQHALHAPLPPRHGCCCCCC